MLQTWQKIYLQEKNIDYNNLNLSLIDKADYILKHLKSNTNFIILADTKLSLTNDLINVIIYKWFVDTEKGFTVLNISTMPLFDDDENDRLINSAFLIVRYSNYLIDKTNKKRELVENICAERYYKNYPTLIQILIPAQTDKIGNTAFFQANPLILSILETKKKVKIFKFKE